MPQKMMSCRAADEHGEGSLEGRQAHVHVHAAHAAHGRNWHKETGELHAINQASRTPCIKCQVQCQVHACQPPPLPIRMEVEMEMLLERAKGTRSELIICKRCCVVRWASKDLSQYDHRRRYYYHPFDSQARLARPLHMSMSQCQFG